MENTKKTAAKFCLSLLFILGPAVLCQAQSVVRAGQISGQSVPAHALIQSSAPALNGWEVSAGAGTALSVGVVNDMTVAYAPSIAAPMTPDASVTFSPAVNPAEPSTLSLCLVAGSAALLRFGWRKRSN